MNTHTFIPPKKSYFAAANGYDGFRSYFDDVFNPKDYIRLYVLKGGPGTGKSTLMKNICTYFTDMGYECEAIFCSSDPKSLDGVIVNGALGKIGILDGTAPHERDAKIPGAIDEIINLGMAWNKDALTKKRDRILSINREKSNHYKSAYGHLNLAGVIDRKLRTRTANAFHEPTHFIKTKFFNNISDINRGRIDESMLLSSFGKGGFYTLDTSVFTPKYSYNVVGKYGADLVFIDSVLKECKAQNMHVTRFPSPYFDMDTEAIYIHGTETLISTTADAENTIDASEFLDEGLIKENGAALNFYTEQKSVLLSFAKEEFQKAADSHFALESIYSPLMNFDTVNKIQEKIITEIKTII